MEEAQQLLYMMIFLKLTYIPKAVVRIRVIERIKNVKTIQKELIDNKNLILSQQHKSNIIKEELSVLEIIVSIVI